MTMGRVVVFLVLWASNAQAHKPSDSYLTLRAARAEFTAQWDIALRDLDHAIGLDANGDGAITWGEVRVRHDAIGALALARLEIDADGMSCVKGAPQHLIDHHSDGAYAVLRFAVDCPKPPRHLAVHYRLFFDLDPQHHAVVQVDNGGTTRVLLVTAAQPTLSLDLADASARASVREFWRDGVWHIWAGFDHVLFLLTLLLPAVLRRASDGWHIVAFRAAVAGTLKVVTAFSAAHSITLTLAALGVVRLPGRVVESAIAASVVVAALNNTYPLFHHRRWLIGFVFGLLHGFGFASVLADADPPRTQLVLALLGFNAGVETGQLAIVAVFLPLAFVARRSWLYQRFTLVVGSSLIAILAAIWLVERALGLRIVS